MLSKLYIKGFRNYNDRLFEFSDRATVIVGANAIGKSNLLEAIYLLSTGKSFKASVEKEMVNWDTEIARVKGLLVNEDGEMKPEVVLTRGEISVGGSKTEKAPRKKLLLNGVGKRLVDFVGNLPVVLFAPQDLELVTESPSIRRKFLDSVLSQTDKEYVRSLRSYEKGLRQRNKLLIKIRESLNDPLHGETDNPRNQLAFWDRLLIKNGDYITSARASFIDYVNSMKSNVTETGFQLEYDKSVISETRIEQYAREEVYAGTTLVGPHRDDMIFTIEKSNEVRNLDSFGSRGEQRMGVLWLKLAELQYVEEKLGKRPMLLLDDIFSELDHAHRDIVMEVVTGQQTIITTADPHFVENYKESLRIDLNETTT